MNYVAPIVVGVLAAIGAPVVQSVLQVWMQARTERNNRRARLVDSWRQGLASAGDDLAAKEVIRASAWYETLRPYLNADVRRKFEFGPRRDVLVVEVSPPRTPGTPDEIDLRVRRNFLADRIDELARSWNVD